MNQELPLADIHTPGAISAWPPAYGWWILLAIVIVIIIALIHQWRKRKAERLAQKLALIELDNINLNDFGAGQQINAILKRAAMHYFERENIASLNGAKWQNFLVNSLKRQHKSAVDFDDSWVSFAYKDKIEAKQVIEFHQFAKLWIRKALPGKAFSDELTQSHTSEQTPEPTADKASNDTVEAIE